MAFSEGELNFTHAVCEQETSLGFTPVSLSQKIKQTSGTVPHSTTGRKTLDLSSATPVFRYCSGDDVLFAANPVLRAHAIDSPMSHMLRRRKIACPIKGYI